MNTFRKRGFMKPSKFPRAGSLFWILNRSTFACRCSTVQEFKSRTWRRVMCVHSLHKCGLERGASPVTHLPYHIPPSLSPSQKQPAASRGLKIRPSASPSLLRTRTRAWWRAWRVPARSEASGGGRPHSAATVPAAPVRPAWSRTLRAT